MALPRLAQVLLAVPVGLPASAQKLPLAADASWKMESALELLLGVGGVVAKPAPLLALPLRLPGPSI